MHFGLTAPVESGAARLVGIAFETARAAVKRRADLTDEMIARKIIELAKTGERDVEVLCEAALNVPAGAVSIPNPPPLPASPPSSPDTIYRALKELGFSHMSARPKSYILRLWVPLAWPLRRFLRWNHRSRFWQLADRHAASARELLELDPPQEGLF